MSQAPHESAPQAAHALPIIGGALGFGAVSFAILAVVLPRSIGEGLAEGEAPDPDQVEFVQLLSMVHGAVLLGALAVAFTLPAALAKKAAGADGPDTRVQGSLLRWAALEGASLFGTVVVLLAGLNDVVPAHPVYYANLISLVVFGAVLLSDLFGGADRPRDDRP
ncbi:MAG: hypothetical protein ACYS26_12605 [Planctomycetota bacterium]|jgi:hypothetical protein